MKRKKKKKEDMQSKKSQAAKQEFIACTVIIKRAHLNASVYSCSAKAMPPFPQY